MPAKSPRRRRPPVGAGTVDLPEFTPALERALCQAAGLAPGPSKGRGALVHAVRVELCGYRASTVITASQPGTARRRAGISELMRAAEALLRALGDVEPETAAMLTDGPGGIDMRAWAKDLHELWDRLVLLDRQLEAREDSFRAAPRREVERATLGRLIDVYRTHGANGGDLLTFLREACACVSLPLPKTDEKLIGLISQIPTLA